jgi:hypothetical protein
VLVDGGVGGHAEDEQENKRKQRQAALESGQLLPFLQWQNRKHIIGRLSRHMFVIDMDEAL